MEAQINKVLPGSLAPFDYNTIEDEVRTFVRTSAIEIKTLIRQLAQVIIEIGQKLIEVKEKLLHGQWLPWLMYEFEWSDRTAQRFIRVAKEFQIGHDVTDLNIPAKALYLLASPTTPDSAKEDILDRAQDGKMLPYKQVQAIVEAHKRIEELEKELKSKNGNHFTRDQVKQLVSDLEEKIKEEQKEKDALASQLAKKEPESKEMRALSYLARAGELIKKATIFMDNPSEHIAEKMADYIQSIRQDLETLTL